MAMYSSPASRAASAIVRTSSLPSVSVLCMWRSPRRSARSIRRGSARRAGGVDLAAHLAQLRRNPVEAERGVDVFLALAGDAHVVRGPEQAVFVQLEAEADRAVAQRDVVGLRSGEVLQRGAAAVGGDEAQIGLEAALEEDARFRVAVAEHALDQTVLDERVHQRCRRAGGEQIEVAAACRSRAAGCRPARWRHPARARGGRRRAPRRRRARRAAGAGRRTASVPRAPSG